MDYANLTHERKKRNTLKDQMLPNEGNQRAEKQINVGNCLYKLKGA